MPIARVIIPKIKSKIEYIENGTRFRDLGVLENGEEWNGDIIEEYAHFWFEKDYAECWLREGILWEPSSRDFQDWEEFYDEEKTEFVVSYYSMFQCYTLYNITRMTSLDLHAEWWYTYSDEDISELISQISDWANHIINTHKKSGTRGEIAPMVCQILSNRFFPKTQTDRRTINLSISGNYHNWDWYEYCRKWNSKAILESVSLSTNDIRKLHQLLSMDAEYVDPLENWYGLISYVSLEKKKKLKGKALLAQLIYSMEHMLRLFYKELTHEKLYPPGENSTWKRDNFYGEGVTDNDLRYLEFLANEYHLNPRPKLILVVEGNGEEEQFPRLSQELFGHTFSKLGIEVVNINGVGGFTGKKGFDKYGALEKFIDDYHNRQTIVFVVLDNEGRTMNIKNKLVKATSKYFPNRFVTKAKYIHLWDQKTIEYDNFSFDEIAEAMSEISANEDTFTSDEIKECHLRSRKKEGDHLSKLYNERTGHNLYKPELLRTLFGYIIKNAKNEFDAVGVPCRPICKVIRLIIELASSNHQPTRYDTWKTNQESGYFGDIIK